MLKTFLLIAAMTLSMSLHAYVGTYRVTGYDPYEKKPYSGTAVIVKNHKTNVYRASWNFSNGERFQGTGLMAGDELVFTFASKDAKLDGKHVMGLKSYKFDGKVLQGSWVLMNQILVGSEKLEKK